MTRKDIQTVYGVIGENKNISLYKECKYRGSVCLKNRRAYITHPLPLVSDYGYSDVESLSKRLNEANALLRYDIGTYDPSMKEDYRTATRIHQYLDSLGFSVSHKNWGLDTYVKVMCPNFSIHVIVKVKDNTTEGSISMTCDDFTSERNFNGEEEAIDIINYFLKLQLLSSVGSTVNLLNKIGEGNAVNADMYRMNFGSFNVEHFSFKDSMIMMLEEEIKKLRRL